MEEPRLAAHIFDLMEKFAGYGFNKSHSAAYALLSYQTACLKAHYPAAFMAAVLSADMDHTDKVVTLIDECAHIELTVLPPDINSSSYMFAVADERTIRYGLGATSQRQSQRGCGGRGRGRDRKAFQELVRPVLGASICARLNRRLRSTDPLGRPDGLGCNRATLMANLEQAMQASEQSARSREAGQVDIFGSSALAAASAALTLKPVAEWSASQRLAGERETLGLYLTGHPIAPYEQDLRYFASGRIADFASERPSRRSIPHAPTWMRAP